MLAARRRELDKVQSTIAPPDFVEIDYLLAGLLLNVPVEFTHVLARRLVAILAGHDARHRGGGNSWCSVWSGAVYHCSCPLTACCLLTSWLTCLVSTYWVAARAHGRYVAVTKQERVHQEGGRALAFVRLQAPQQADVGIHVLGNGANRWLEAVVVADNEVEPGETVQGTLVGVLESFFR